MLLPNLYARVRFCQVHWHARPRVRRAPGLPCALFQVEGNETFKPRVKDAARSRKHAHVTASAAAQSMSPVAGSTDYFAFVRLHTDNFLFSVAVAKTLSRSGASPQDTWCCSPHTRSALIASSLAKEPRCSQTCRKCVWSIDGDH